MTEPIIHADGIHFGLTDEEYHADPALGASGIVDLVISPMRFWAKSPMNELREPDTPTDATKFGDLAHLAVFQPDKCDFVVKPDGMNFGSKDGKAWKEENEGKTIITAKDDRQLQMILLALEKTHVLEQIRRSGVSEVAFFWTENGHRCKIKVDHLQHQQSWDLKTMANTMDKDQETLLAHTVAAYRYHIKAIWYHRGIEKMRRIVKEFDASKDLISNVHSPDCPSKKHIELLQKMHENPFDGIEFPHWFVFVEKGGVPHVNVRKFVRIGEGSTSVEAYWQAAKRAVDQATSAYARYMEKFGPNEPWIEKAPFKEFNDLDFGPARWILDEQ